MSFVYICIVLVQAEVHCANNPASHEISISHDILVLYPVCDPSVPVAVRDFLREQIGRGGVAAWKSRGAFPMSV
jgi:hypothetical protein